MKAKPRPILKEKRAEYGEQIFHSLSGELAAEFGRGFTKTNLFNMVRFAEVFPDSKIVHALSGQLSWTYLRLIIYLDDPLKRDFYAEMCRIELWNTRTLNQKVQSMLFERTARSKRPAKPPSMSNCLSWRGAESTWQPIGRKCCRRSCWSGSCMTRCSWRGARPVYAVLRFHVTGAGQPYFAEIWPPYILTLSPGYAAELMKCWLAAHGFSVAAQVTPPGAPVISPPTPTPPPLPLMQPM